MFPRVRSHCGWSKGRSEMAERSGARTHVRRLLDHGDADSSFLREFRLLVRSSSQTPTSRDGLRAVAGWVEAESKKLGLDPRQALQNGGVIDAVAAVRLA